MDIAGLILKFIGGEKLKQVSTVFAEGANITRQNGGGIGLNSIFGQSTAMQAAFPQSGLSGIMSNPMAGNISSLVSSVQGSISSITNAVTTTTSSSGSSGNQTTTTTPTFPTFAPALSNALTTLNSYSRMTNLLTGNAAPDYTTDEYGIADTLDASSNGAASLSVLNAPIAATTLPSSTVTAVQTLITNAQSKSVTDSAATSQLSQYMAPIIAAMSQSQQAYFNATQSSTANTLLSEVFSHLTGISTPESDFIESIMYPQFVNEAMAANQSQAATAAANRADSSPESIYYAEHCRQKLALIREGRLDTSLDSE